MTTFAQASSGPGLGLAAARRFGKSGHSVALLAAATPAMSSTPPR